VLEVIKSSVDNYKAPNKEAADFARCVMMDSDLIGLIKDNVDGNDHPERPATIRKIAKSCGWFVGETLTQFRDHTRGRLICLDAKDAKLKPQELFQEVIPTRIRLLGKKFLVVDSDTLFVVDSNTGANVERGDLDDPLTWEAIRTGKLKMKT
jgi:hypothetical protein